MANFWTNANTSPKRSYRFTLSMGAIGEENTWLVTQVKKPSATIGEVSHKYLNHTFYYPGRVEWDTCNVTLVDPVSPNAAGLMAAALKTAGYTIPGNETVTDAITKKKAIAALGLMKITQFNTNGSDPVETWTLHNGFITNIDWGELNYESDDLTNITITIRYDYASLETPGDASKGGGTFFSPVTAPSTPPSTTET
jgi:hypothetical protein